VLEEAKMTESAVVKEWMKKTRSDTQLETMRDAVLQALEAKFPGAVPGEVVETINAQPSFSLMREWHTAAVKAATIDDFVAVLRR
jgi:hypothetical protein